MWIKKQVISIGVMLVLMPGLMALAALAAARAARDALREAGVRERE